MNKAINAILPGVYFVITKLTPDNMNFRITEYSNFGNYINSIIKVIGKDPREMDFPFADLTQEQLDSMVNRKARYFQEGIYELVHGKINKTICKAVEKLLGIAEVCSFSISVENKFYGAITLFITTTLIKSGCHNSGAEMAIETIANQASAVIQKLRDESALIKKDEVLFHTNQQIETLIENSGSGFILEDASRKILLVNTAFCKIFKIPSPQLISGLDSQKASTMLAELFFEPERFRVDIEDLIRENKTVIDQQILLRDGRVLVRDFIPINKLSLTGYLWQYRDVSDLIRFEKELLISNARFNQLISHLNDIIWKANGDGTEFSDLSNSFEKIYGYSIGEYKEPDFWLEVVHPEDKEIAEKSARDLFSEGSSTSEYRIIRKDGTIRWLNDHKALVFNNKGKPIHMGGIVSDITERKLLEEQLLIKDNALDASPTAVVLANLNGSIIYANNAFVKLWGYNSKNEVVGRMIKEFSAVNKDVERTVSIINQSKDYFGETKAIRKDGTIFDIHVSASMIQSALGKPICMMALFIDITERKHIEEALKESEEELRHSHEAFKNYFELGSVGMCVTSTGKKWIEVNARLCQMFGYSKEELQQHTWADLTYPDDLAADVELFNQVLSGERNSYDLDKRFIHKNGSILYTTLSVTCQRNEDGTVHHLLASLIDITDRKLAEQDYQREKAFMDKLFDSSPEAISVCDEQGRYVRVNTKFLELFGFAKDEVIGKKVDTLIAQDSYHDEADGITKEAHSGRTIELESVRFRKDGTPLDVSIIATSINIGDLLIGGYGIYRDITERKRSEKALRESEEKYKAVFRTIPDAIILTQMDGMVVDVNFGFSKLSGFTKEEAVGSTLLELELYSVPEDRMRLTKTLQTNGMVENFETLIKCKIGSLGTVLISASIISINNRPHVLSLTKDITDRKMVELLLKKQAEELTELNATKDKFFSIIAHDLKNPFNTILGFTDVLLTNFKEFDTHETLKYLNIIDNSSKHAFLLLENLLLWARTQTGTIDFYPEVIELRDIIMDVIVLIANQANKKNISVSSSLQDHCTVIADKNMIESILRNLLTNAIKFTPNNGNIDVSTVKENNQVEISIKDTGVGINKEDLEYIFRIDRKSTTLGTEKEKGTGLGLILCKEFVEKHGGKIWAESEFGGGSTFKFTIPLSN